MNTIDKEVFAKTISSLPRTKERETLAFYNTLEIDPPAEPMFRLEDIRKELSNGYSTLEIPVSKIESLMADAERKSPELGYIARMFAFCDKYSKLRHAFESQWHDRLTLVYLGEHKEQIIRFFDNIYDFFIVMDSGHEADKEEHFNRAMQTNSRHHSDIVTGWVHEVRLIALNKLALHYKQSDIDKLPTKKL